MGGARHCKQMSNPDANDEVKKEEPEEQEDLETGGEAADSKKAKAATANVTKKERASAEEIFKKFDTHGADGGAEPDGLLDKDEFKVAIKYLYNEFKVEFDGSDLTDQDIEALFKKVDRNGDGVVDRGEFTAAYNTLKNFKQAILNQLEAAIPGMASVTATAQTVGDSVTVKTEPEKKPLLADTDAQQAHDDAMNARTGALGAQLMAVTGALTLFVTLLTLYGLAQMVVLWMGATSGESCKTGHSTSLSTWLSV